VVLEGKGFGHGAGLCQWGARVFAEKGWDYRRILSHYYPGTELQTLY
jgi:stage II sporulation protein D